jgi:hypothetical protein
MPSPTGAVNETIFEKFLAERLGEYIRRTIKWPVNE